MRRRIYKLSPKREKIVGEAMNSMRAARNAIEPALLDEARNAIVDAMEKAIAKDEELAVRSNTYKVDRKKNLDIVMQYIQLRPDHAGVKQELRSFIER